MKPKLPTYARGDSIGIAVCPTGVRLDEVEIDMLFYTTGNGVRLYASTRGKGLPIVKGAERAVLNIPPSEAYASTQASPHSKRRTSSVTRPGR